MRITKSQLRRIIREEKRRMRECGEMDDGVEVVSAEPQVSIAPLALAEDVSFDQELVVEMEVASRALSQVVESVQNAAQLCTNCSPEIAAQAPLVEAMVSQAEALQENLEAQVEVMLESASAPSEVPMLDVVSDMLA